jgi:hypothetical protein
MDHALQEVYSALERQRQIRVRPPTVEPHGDTGLEMQAPTFGELATGPERLAAGRARRFSEFQARAVTQADAHFAALGLEAWAIGSQLVAVTLPTKEQ